MTALSLVRQEAKDEDQAIFRRRHASDHATGTR